MHGLAIEHPSAPVSGESDGTRSFRNEDDGTHQAPPAIRARMRFAGKLAWSAAGFLIGAAFWHVVGFWSFVSYVVLGGPDPATYLASSARIVSIASADQAPARPAPATGAHPACVTLALDRTTGETRLEPCEATAVALPHVDASGREDLALLPGRTSPTILPHSDLAPSTSSLND
jgi:hypothetical protein